MKVSIIVPVYNIAPYIVRCLFSILNQNHKNLDVVLVNDCTPDNSVELINDFIAEHNTTIFTLLHHEVNKGASEAKNTGINAAVGDYVYFLDGDDEITPNCIECLVENIDSPETEMVLGGMVYPNGKSYFKNRVGSYTGDEFRKLFLHRYVYSVICNRLVKRDFLLANKLFFIPISAHEDNLWSYQATMCTKSVKIIDTPTYIYHVREGSLSEFATNNIQLRIRAFNFVENDLSERNLTKDANNYLVGHIFLIHYIAVTTKHTINEIQDLNIDRKYPFKGLNLTNTLKNIVVRLPKGIRYTILSIANRIIK